MPFEYKPPHFDGQKLFNRNRQHWPWLSRHKAQPYGAQDGRSNGNEAFPCGLSPSGAYLLNACVCVPSGQESCIISTYITGRRYCVGHRKSISSTAAADATTAVCAATGS